MPNGTYGGVRGRKTKVGRKLLRLPPTRFRHFKADIAHSAAFSYPSVSFAPFCIVLRIKVLTVLP